MSRSTALVLITAMLAGGCLVVSRDHLDQLQASDAGEQTDGDVPTPDAGVDAGADDLIRVIDRCGDSAADYVVLDDSTQGQLRVDTTGMTNRIMSCGSRAAPGSDGFIAIDVIQGDQWHFHVIPDPSVAGQDRDPFLYLLSGAGGSCDGRDCDHASDACRGAGDEHFAFVAPSDGRFYLGIDDRVAGGGHYLLQAVKLFCGDGMKVHGEACDGTADCQPRTCREMLSVTRPSEQIPNDNEIEANFITFPASNEITITGSIGGDLCTYPDVFTFSVPAGTDTLTATIRKSDGTVCDNSSLTPFSIILRDGEGGVRAGPMTNPTTSCAELTATGVAGSTFFLYLEHSDPIEDRTVAYQLHLALSI